jgi:tetratricopeptide (TPR) repeat protein
MKSGKVRYLLLPILWLALLLMMGQPVSAAPLRQEDQIKSLFERAMVKANDCAFAEAIALLQQLLDQHPDSEWADDAQAHLGAIHFAQGQYEQAIVESNKLLTKFPNSEWADDAQAILAFSFLFEGEAEQAQHAFQTLANDYPNSQYSFIAQMMLSLGDLAGFEDAKAFIPFSQIFADCEISPGLPIPPVTDGGETLPPLGDNEIVQELLSTEGDGDTLLEAGVALYRRSRYPEALQKLEAALAYYQDPPTKDRPGEGTALTHIGHIYRSQGRYAEALERYEQALDIFRVVNDQAGQAAALNGMGLVYVHQGYLSKALNNFHDALTLTRAVNDRTEEAVALDGIGEVYLAQGRYPEALDSFQEALARWQELSDSFGQATTLNNIGEVLRPQGRYAEALTHYQQALATAQEIGSRAEEGVSLSNMGVVYAYQGRITEALSQLEQALAIQREIGNRAGEGITLVNIAFVYRTFGFYTEALDNLQPALVISQETGLKRVEGAVLNTLGTLDQAQGRYDEALKKYQQALIIRQEVDDRPGEGVTLHNIAGLHQAQGRYSEALENYQQALKIQREVGNRPMEGTTLNNIGQVYWAQGRYTAALDSLQQALDIAREVGNRNEEGVILNNMGAIHQAQGRYHQALQSFQQALAIHQALNNLPLQGTTLNNIGAIYSAQGRYAEALAQYQQALTTWREASDRAGEGTTLNNIGAVYGAQGRYAEALAQYQQALTISREVGDRVGEGNTLNNIGTVHDNQGRYAEALAQYQQALTIWREVGDRAKESTILNNIGWVYAAQGRYAEALAQYQQALIISREVGDRVGEGNTLHNIGEVYADQGQVDLSLDTYLQAMAIIEAVRATAGSEAGRAAFIARYAGLYSRTAGLFHQQGQDEDAFLTAERGRARAFLDSLATGHVELTDETAAGLLAQEQEAYAQRQAAQDALARAKALSPPDPELVADLKAQLAEAEAAHVQALAALEAQSEQLAGLVPGRGAKNILSVSQVQALLDEQTTLLSYFVLEEQTLVFLLSRNQFEVVELPLSSEQLTNHVSRFRDALALRQAQATRSVAQDLYQLLLAPLADRLDTPRLMIIPHGALHYLPFAALLNPNTGEYLIQRHSLVTLPGASTLPFITTADRRLPSVKPPGGTAEAEQGEASASSPPHLLASPLIIGNPTPGDFDATASLATERAGLAPLPFAEKEAEAIAKLYGVEPLLKEAATESAVRTQVAQAGILHLAAHGSYNPVAPLSSLIALAPDGENDGWLTVGEVYGLQLAQTDLVVLSACQSQLGELSQGDELVGLTRAFLFAGTPTVVASLWNVDDAATGLLMERFYTHLKAGVGKAQALRQAQLEVMADYPDPYYWAAFVMSGDGGEVSESSLSASTAVGTVEASAETPRQPTVVEVGFVDGRALLYLLGGGAVLGGLAWWLWRQKRVEKN